LSAEILGSIEHGPCLFSRHTRPQPWSTRDGASPRQRL